MNQLFNNFTLKKVIIEPKKIIMQSQSFNEELSSISLRELQVLLESQLIEIKQVEEAQIQSQHQLLIYFHQLQQKSDKHQVQKSLLQICTKLLNDDFKNKKVERKQAGHEQNQDNEFSQKIRKFSEQEHQHDHQEIYNDESKLLGPQIYQKIHSHFPQAYQLINPSKVPQFNFFHSSNILDLVTIELQITTNFTSAQQIILIVQNIILPIIHSHPDFCVKGVEIIMTVINYFGKDSAQKAEVIKKLSQIVTSLCLSFNNTFETLSIQQIISLMTAIQAIHSASENYHLSLTKSKLFHSFIKRMLMCSNVQSKTANSIAVNIYGALLKQSNLYSNEAEIFINLYSTLRCFGAHLIKDIWSLFYDFIEIEGNDLIFTKAELIDIIFYKIENHENANVVKHCIQSILQEERSFILFNKVPDAIFNSLIRILNYGMHYLDCLFHMDSKMFPMISNFFGNFFNNEKICKDEDFENLIKLFLKAISQKITFDHALVAMLHSFKLITRKSNAIGKEKIQLISTLVRKYYVKYPIRKKHQMMNGICYLLKNHLNSQKKGKSKCTSNITNLVDLPYLLKNCLNYFPEDYILLKYNGEEKRNQIYEIISSNFTKEEINQTLIKYALKIKEIVNHSTLSSDLFLALVQTLKSIQFILYLTEKKQNKEKSEKLQNKFYHFQIQTIEELRDVYSSICERFVTDLGESLYKCKQQRLNGIYVQKVCLDKVFAMKSMIAKFDTCNFIQKALTNVSLLVKDCIQSESKLILSKEDLKICQFIVKRCFEMIYEFSSIEDKQMEQKACRVGSQFLEWATDHIQHAECHLLILTALKTRIHQSNISPIEYIEESIYNIFWSLFALEYKNKFSQKQSSQFNQPTISSEKLLEISPLYRLRLFTLCCSILFYDDNEVRKFYPYVISNIEEISDRYDFENLDEVFYFVQLIYTCQDTAVDKKTREEFLSDSPQVYLRISKVINSIIQTMLNSLNYGVDSKEVISCTNCILNIMFDFASKFNHFSPQLVELSIKTLRIGQEYWMFERMIAFKTIQNLSIMLERHQKISYKGLYPLLSKILCIEEYRGYDSAVALENQLSKKEFYTQLKLILLKEADYEGLTCRLAFVEFVNSLVEYSLRNAQDHHQNHSLDQFLQEFFLHLFEESKKDTNQKMFLTGDHKKKLKHWQCIIAYHPEWFIQACKTKKNWLNLTVQELIIQIIEIVDKNNNLFEVKYYIELFLMKLMINEHSEKIISERILNLLSTKLLELTSQVNKNVSFIFISGSLMNFLFRTYQITKTHKLYSSLEKLYNSILIYSCSHVAYFRGLSQYFCLEKLFVDSQYTRILHQQIGKDADTILLKNKLNTIVNDYYDQIQYWNVRNNLFKQHPTLNDNIVSETFYMDRLKKLGQQLLREIRAQIGFLPYKQIWLQVVKSLNLTNNIQIDIEKEQLNKNSQQQAIFQRKIDPSLDFIYFSKTKLQGFDIKILITGSKSIPIYGHLSRTGQIFGLSQLIIPYKEIIEDEEFKNVACTAEKWLNISWFSNKQEMENRQRFQLSLEKELLAKKQEGYAFFLLKKHENLDQELLKQQLEKVHSINKILLILDLENYLPSSIESLLQGKICFGKYFSQHVEASIFIWEYFKQVYGKKFRTQELKVC